jgi:hypothetical protein
VFQPCRHRSKEKTIFGGAADYETLQPRLDALVGEYAESARQAEALERRIAGLVQQYGTQVDGLSGLFVEWDEVVREAEGSKKY